MGELQDAIKNIERNFTGQDKAGVPRAAAALDVIVLMKAARRWVAVQKAITEEGSRLSHHQSVMARHQKEWPTLWAVLDVTTEDT